MSERKIKNSAERAKPTYSTNIIKCINAEINAPHNKALLVLGLVAAAGAFGYIIYMRKKYERLGYYMAIKEDGRTEFLKKKSNWET